MNIDDIRLNEHDFEANVLATLAGETISKALDVKKVHLQKLGELGLDPRNSNRISVVGDDIYWIVSAQRRDTGKWEAISSDGEIWEDMKQSELMALFKKEKVASTTTSEEDGLIYLEFSDGTKDGDEREDGLKTIIEVLHRNKAKVVNWSTHPNGKNTWMQVQLGNKLKSPEDLVSLVKKRMKSNPYPNLKLDVSNVWIDGTPTSINASNTVAGAKLTLQKNMGDQYFLVSDGVNVGEVLKMDIPQGQNYWSVDVLGRNIRPKTSDYYFSIQEVKKDLPRLGKVHDDLVSRDLKELEAKNKDLFKKARKRRNYPDDF